MRVSARADAQPVGTASSRARCDDSGPPATSPSSTARTSRSRRRPRHRIGQFVLGGGLVVVRHDDLAACHLAGERRAVLDDERVGTHVIDVHRHRRVEGRTPVVERFAGRAVDQVDADVLEPGFARPSDGQRYPLRIVRAVEHRQHMRHRRLHPEGDPGEPAGPKFGQRLGRDAVRVGLGRHLGVRREPELGRRRRCRIRTRSAVGSCVGVPPPKNTVSTAPTPEPLTQLGRISAIAVSAYDARVAPSPSSSAVYVLKSQYPHRTEQNGTWTYAPNGVRRRTLR